MSDKKIWQNFLLHYSGPFGESEDIREYVWFRDFVVKLPDQKSMKMIFKKPLTIESLMEMHYVTVSLFADLTKSEFFKRCAVGLSQYEFAKTFLWVLYSNPDGYCLEAGMTRAELKAMESGELSVRRLLINRPDVILYPIVRQFKGQSVH